MARTLPSLIATAQVSNQAETPGFLVGVYLDIWTARITTLDVDFTFGGQVWFASDVSLTGLQWGADGSLAGTMVLGDVDLQWWYYTLQLKLQDAKVLVWQVYASALGEAEPLWSGRIGTITKGEGTVECTLVNEAVLLRAPSVRVQNVIPGKYLLPSGTIIKVGSSTWKLDRKQNR